MDKPTGVKIIAIVFFILGGLAILGGFGILAITPPSTPLTDLIIPYIIGVGIAIIVIGGVEVATGWGLWNLQSWSRIAAIILLALFALVNLLSGVSLIFGVEVEGINISSPGQGIASVLIGLLYAWGVWYLFKPDVIHYFEGTPIEQTVMAPPVYNPPPPPVPASVPPAPSTSLPVSPKPSPPTEVIGAPSQAAAWLVSKRKGDNKSYALSGNNIVIGRDPSRAVIVIDGDTISAEHARVRIEGGQFYLHDLASTNGTFVNNHRIERHLLRDNDIVRFGQVEMTFKKV